MRRAALLIAFLTAGAAFGQEVAPSDSPVGPSGATTQTANSAAGNHPAALATEGVSLKNQCRLVVTVSAASGQTLSGGGSLVFWYYNSTLGRWAPNVETGASVSMAGAASLRDVTIFVREIFPGAGDRVYVEADTVTASGGALTVRLRTIHCGTVYR